MSKFRGTPTSAWRLLSLFDLILHGGKNLFDLVLCGFHLVMIKLRLGKSLDEFMVDVPSSIEEEQTDPRIPTITVTSDFASQLESMRILDEDELFLAELMAIHPNDQDIVVEDLEQVDPPDFSDDPEVVPGIVLEHPESPASGVDEAQEAEEDGVSSLKKFSQCRSQLSLVFGRPPSAISF